MILNCKEPNPAAAYSIKDKHTCRNHILKVAPVLTLILLKLGHMFLKLEITTVIIVEFR